MRAFLIGKEPPCSLGYVYSDQGDWDAVVIGSLTYGQLLRLDMEEALEALAAGKPVLLYEPGLPPAKGSRGLSSALAARKRELKAWGVIFTSGDQKKLITAQAAKQMLEKGTTPTAGAVLTPLAKEILEGKANS